MIYALNTKDVSEHERRIIARLIRDDKHHLLGIEKKGRECPGNSHQ